MNGKLATDEPVDGWIAVGDTVGKGGLLFVFDYNYLERIYSSGSTAEWSLEPVNLPSGQTFETDYLICPFTGMDSLRGYSLYYLKRLGLFKTTKSRTYLKAETKNSGTFGKGSQWKLVDISLTDVQKAELDANYDGMMRFLERTK